MLQQKFSKMTPICSTMSHERLNHCMIFSTHKEEVDKLTLTKLATKFVKKFPKHERIFAVNCETQCARTDLNKRFLPKQMTTTG